MTCAACVILISTVIEFVLLATTAHGLKPKDASTSYSAEAILERLAMLKVRTGRRRLLRAMGSPFDQLFYPFPVLIQIVRRARSANDNLLSILIFEVKLRDDLLSAPLLFSGARSSSEST